MKEVGKVVIFCICVSLFISGAGGKVVANSAKNVGRRTSGKDKNTRNANIGSGSNSVATSMSSSETCYQKNQSECLDALSRFAFRNASNEERLLLYLFHDYITTARAVMDTDKTIVVKINFVLLRIHGLEERRQFLTTTGLIMAEWTDERLTWQPEMFGNVRDIILNAESIWLPEIAVMNGAEELVPDFDRIRVLLNHDGRLHWEPGGIFKTTCDIDIAYFPLDTQHCPILIGAYSYYIDKMNITNASDVISTHDFQQNSEWLIYRTSAEWKLTILDCCPGKGYPHVVFTLHLKRRCKFYLMNIVLPCQMLSVLIMVGFFLPPEAGEKISLGISVLIAFTVFLLMIAETIPRTSLAIPLIVVYLMTTMTLGTISICMTVLVLNVHHRHQREKFRPWWRKLILVHLAKVLRVQTSYRSIYKSEQKVWKRRPGSSSSSDRLPFQINGMIANNIEETVRLTSCRQNNSPCNQNNGGPRYKLPPSKGDRQAALTTPSSSCRAVLLSRSSVCDDLAYFSSSPSPSKKNGLPSSSTDWKDAARVLDRLFFWLICTMMTSSTIFILFYPIYSGVD